MARATDRPLHCQDMHASAWQRTPVSLSTGVSVVLDNSHIPLLRLKTNKPIVWVTFQVYLTCFLGWIISLGSMFCQVELQRRVSWQKLSWVCRSDSALPSNLAARLRCLFFILTGIGQANPEGHIETRGLCNWSNRSSPHQLLMIAGCQKVGVVLWLRWLGGRWPWTAGDEG